MAELSVKEFEKRVDTYGVNDPIGLPFKRSLDELDITAKETVPRKPRRDLKTMTEWMLKIYGHGPISYDDFNEVFLCLEVKRSDTALRVKRHLQAKGLVLRFSQEKREYRIYREVVK